MTELDHAPTASKTADHKPAADQEPAGELRPGSADSQTRYPRAVSAADSDPGYYDDTQKALASDNTPTRQQAFRDATARDKARASGNDATTETPAAPVGSPGSDTHAILHENDNQPDPRTRQQATRDAAVHDQGGGPATPAASREVPAGQRTPDTKAILHESDNLPEPAPASRQPETPPRKPPPRPGTTHPAAASSQRPAPTP